MTRVTQIKLGLAILALTCFFVGVRLESDLWRWSGIGLAAVAWGLRFVAAATRRAAKRTGDQEPTG